jgi:hypothetical protein
MKIDIKQLYTDDGEYDGCDITNNGVVIGEAVPCMAREGSGESEMIFAKVCGVEREFSTNEGYEAVAEWAEKTVKRLTGEG